LFLFARRYPSTLVSLQTRTSNPFYPDITLSSPPFSLPVVYEDAHLAVVNKPAGVVVYSHKKGGHGTNTIRACLPYVLRPPPDGTEGMLRRPQPVHRLDKPTSGLLVVAKTKAAMVALSESFRERRVEKEYLAVLNGVLAHEEGVVEAIIPKPAPKMGVTFYKALSTSRSLRAAGNLLTLARFRPRTGRYHQLRYHASGPLGAPIVGDAEHDATEEGRSFMERGLFLCASRVAFPHPAGGEGADFGGGAVWRDEEAWVELEVETPEKFGKFLQWEEERYNKFAGGGEGGESGE
jgi:23S rRNA pseudouridine1911/1915/1917 synthase